MECSKARFLIGADPGTAEQTLVEHLVTCAPCACFFHEIRRLDDRLRTAMAVPVPLGARTTEPCAAAPRRVSRRFPQQFAIAASVAAVAVLVGLLWIGVPRPSLASAIVAHMAEEQGAWTTTSPLSPTAVAAVLAEAGLRLDTGLTDVTYAHSCWFRGRYVPHLVVQTADGPVTILVLPYENVPDRTEFSEGGYRGALVPATRGSLAVLARDGGDVDAVVARATAAVGYLN